MIIESMIFKLICNSQKFSKKLYMYENNHISEKKKTFVKSYSKVFILILICCNSVMIENRGCY